MLRIRPYKTTDAKTVLSWIPNEKVFYQWSAGTLGQYPPSLADFSKLGELMQFTALEDKEIVGYFTLRNTGDTLDELRLGYIILHPEQRGKGYGQAMLRLGIQFAFAMYGAKRVSVGVFENNPSALRCYRALGFTEAASDFPSAYTILGETWPYINLCLEKAHCTDNI